MTAMKLILITVCAGFANAARRAQLSDAIAVTEHEPTQTPGNQLKGLLTWVSSQAENLNGVVAKAAEQAHEIVDDLEKVQKKREQRSIKIAGEVLEFVEEVKQNDLMQKVGDLAATMQKDPENAKQKAEELMALMAEKNKLVQKGTELLSQYQEAAESDEQAKEVILQEIAQSAWVTKLQQKANELKAIVSNPEAAQEVLAGTEVGNRVNGLVAHRKKDEKKVEQKTMELMDNVMKVEWVKKAKKIMNMIGTDPQVAQEEVDKLQQEIASAQLVQKAGDIVIQLRKNEESHQERVHELHQVLTKEWQGAVDKLTSPEERQHILQKMVEESPNVAQKVRKYIDDAKERQQALEKQAGEMAVELSQNDMVQTIREVIDEIGNNPELARQKAIGLMQELSRQNELLRKGTGLVQSVAENQQLEDEENNDLFEKLLNNTFAQEAGRIFSSWTTHSSDIDSDEDDSIKEASSTQASDADDHEASAKVALLKSEKETTTSTDTESTTTPSNAANRRLSCIAVVFVLLTSRAS